MDVWKYRSMETATTRRCAECLPALQGQIIRRSRIKVRNDRRCGFTLIEMIITITIIIVLSTISVPIYKNYQEDAILAEAYVLLGTIREAQKNYYSEWGNFLTMTRCSGGKGFTNNEEVLGIDARGNKYFTWFSVNGYGGNDFGTARRSYYFYALVHKRGQLYDSPSLGLQYNISLGQKIFDGMDNYDDSWM